ncbi:MAG: hypothetical protein QGH40_06040, partial [bacterium]|nr:hypothetical protein [bacterium]
MSRFKFLEFTDKKAQGTEEEIPPAEFTADYFFEKAQALFREGHFEKSLRLFSRTLEEDNDYDSAWACQAWALIYLDELPEAEVWTDRGLGKFPDSPELLSLKGLLLARKHEFTEAMEFSDGAINQDVSFPESVWLARGEILLMGGSGNERHCFLRAIDLKPKDSLVLIRIGHIYLQYGYPDQALSYLNKAKTLPFSGHWLWLVLARCYERMEDNEKALKYYRSAVRVSPNLPDATSALRRLKPRGPIDRLVGSVLRM